MSSKLNITSKKLNITSNNLNDILANLIVQCERMYNKPFDLFVVFGNFINANAGNTVTSGKWFVYDGVQVITYADNKINRQATNQKKPTNTYKNLA